MMKIIGVVLNCEKKKIPFWGTHTKKYFFDNKKKERIKFMEFLFFVQATTPILKDDGK